MKTSIKLAAILLVASTGIFATASAKTMDVPSKKAGVTLSSLPSNNGVKVKLDESTAGKAIVMIYDQDRNVLRKDILAKSGSIQKGYVLNKLENGDYTIEVTANNQVVKKSIHVYDEDNNRVFLVKE
jgi:hypothetical protein